MQNEVKKHPRKSGYRLHLGNEKRQRIFFLSDIGILTLDYFTQSLEKTDDHNSGAKHYTEVCWYFGSVAGLAQLHIAQWW